MLYLSQAGATPGVGLQAVHAGSGLEINCTIFIYAILQNRRLSRPSGYAASGGGRKVDIMVLNRRVYISTFTGFLHWYRSTGKGC